MKDTNLHFDLHRRLLEYRVIYYEGDKSGFYIMNFLCYFVFLRNIMILILEVI